MKKGTILIVDDNSDNLRVAAGIVNSEGYEIILARSGKECIDCAMNSSLDAILLDVMMPEMDGYETCKALKENPKTSEIPIIFQTAKGEASHIELAFKSGGTDHITKPLIPEVLLARLQSHVERYKYIRALRDREREFQLLTDHSTDLLLWLDSELQIRYLNKSFCKLFDNDRTKLLKSSFKSIVHEDDYSLVCERLSQLNQFPHNSFLEHRIITNDGIRWIAWNNQAIVDSNGKLCSVVSIGRDTTKQKMLEQKLIQKEKTLNKILQSIDHPVVLLTPDLKVEYINQDASAKIYSKTPQMIEGRTCYKALGKNSSCIDCPVLRSLKTGEAETSCQMRELGKAYKISARPIVDENGNIEYIVETFTDISDYYV